jgi:hypothetical protein
MTKRVNARSVLVAEDLVAEDVKEATWLRFRRLTSSVLCRKILTRRASELDSTLPEKLGAVLLEKKAAQTAWAVRSALGYWEASHVGLNAKVLSRYYALLQISIAEQVASPSSSSSLEEVQRHTEAGHGLFTLKQPGAAFPAGYYVVPLGAAIFTNMQNIIASIWRKSRLVGSRQRGPETNRIKSQGWSL